MQHTLYCVRKYDYLLYEQQTDHNYVYGQVAICVAALLAYTVHLVPCLGSYSVLRLE
jgi:hypothetical protein